MSSLNMEEQNLDECNKLLNNVIILCSMNKKDIHIRMKIQNCMLFRLYHRTGYTLLNYSSYHINKKSLKNFFFYYKLMHTEKLLQPFNVLQQDN